ncbi:hypothetical protein AAFF_G00234640 [Aldrovandia affinis]|uniref:Uncharacterized protein n=1 Tax=Aldrovandia affinis TaxID=143900 RepID=A0AAD7SWT0_9TELE|nr:hypothetical protein AAFF_G00234640 [Aldrovandia affinis]
MNPRQQTRKNERNEDDVAAVVFKTAVKRLEEKVKLTEGKVCPHFITTVAPMDVSMPTNPSLAPAPAAHRRICFTTELRNSHQVTLCRAGWWLSEANRGRPSSTLEVQSRWSNPM